VSPDPLETESLCGRAPAVERAADPLHNSRINTKIQPQPSAPLQCAPAIDSTNTVCGCVARSTRAGLQNPIPTSRVRPVLYLQTASMFALAAPRRALESYRAGDGALEQSRDLRPSARPVCATPKRGASPPTSRGCRSRCASLEVRPARRGAAKANMLAVRKYNTGGTRLVGIGFCKPARVLLPRSVRAGASCGRRRRLLSGLSKSARREHQCGDCDGDN
jgi:hypothetical protein